MFNGTILRAFGRRKIETTTMGAVAAIFTIGLANGEPPAASTATSAPQLRYLAEASGAPAPAPAAPAIAKSATSGLPDLEHSRVDSWIKRFTTSQRGSFATYLRRMTSYEEMISGKLADRGMPQGLIYLAMIESGFDPNSR